MCQHNQNSITENSKVICRFKYFAHRHINKSATFKLNLNHINLHTVLIDLQRSLMQPFFFFFVWRRKWKFVLLLKLNVWQPYPLKYLISHLILWNIKIWKAEKKRNCMILTSLYQNQDWLWPLACEPASAWSMKPTQQKWLLLELRKKHWK